MYNTDMPSQSELPSSGQLIRSTIIAAIAAAVILVTVVMPAEYAIDPTGAGRFLGLTEMGEIKAQLAEEAALDQAAQPTAMPSKGVQAQLTLEPEAGAAALEESSKEPAVILASTQSMAELVVAEPERVEPVAAPEPQWRDEIRVVLTPGEGTEYKLTMKEGAVAAFSWVSEGGPLNYDTHGDTKGKSISYEKGRGVPEDEGELVAAFTGNHGWFFRNRNKENITLVLRTKGDYGEFKKMM